MNRLLCLAMMAAFSLLLAGCDSAHGQPREVSEAISPREVSDFEALFAQNCAGCHGDHGRNGVAISLANPVYLAIASESDMRKVIAQGAHGTSMPAFAESAGGMLTEKQINTIVSGMLLRWARKGTTDGMNPPAYAEKDTGSAAKGEVAYGNYCARCHGPKGLGGPKGSSITNDSFLALVSNQGLRTIVILGRAEFGAPDWRGNAPGRPMTEQDIADVVAWLASKRVPTPGQPYPAEHYGKP